MKKLSALALAGLLAAPGAFAADFQFGGDADFDYYNTRDVGDRFTGFEQRIRLQMAADAGNGVSVNARLNLINDRWTGDDSGGDGSQESPYTAGNRDHRNVQLDYGFVRFPLGPGALSVGRQISNWNNDFTASDDRRDRIGYATRIAGQVLSVSYDRRRAPDPAFHEADRNQLNIALLGPIGDTGWRYGVLLSNWEASGSGGGDALRGATLFAPYVNGVIGPVDLMIGGHYFGDSRGGAYTEDTFGYYVRGGFQASQDIRLEAQVAGMESGTLVAGGWDSFSSLIHNSPDHNASATRIGGLNLSGSGVENQEDNSILLMAIRAQLAVTPQLTITPALGLVNYETYSAATGDPVIDDEDVVFYDLRADYQLNPATSLFAAVGYADSEDALGQNTSGFVTGFNVQF